MGVSTQDLAIARGRPLTVDAVREYATTEGEQIWQLDRRSCVDRYPFVIRQLLKFLFWWKGISPPGHWHDMGKYSSEEKAQAQADYWRGKPECKGDLWVVYPAGIDEGFPLDRVRPQGLYALRESAQTTRYAVVEKQQLESLVEILSKTVNGDV